jgi:hypothetical protein
VTRWQRLVRGLAGVRAEVLDVVGMGLLAAAAFTWSMTAGLVAAGVGVLALNWHLDQGRG